MLECRRMYERKSEYASIEEVCTHVSLYVGFGEGRFC
jgi:hypothetical protein